MQIDHQAARAADAPAVDVVLSARTSWPFCMLDRDLRRLKELPSPRSPEAEALCQVLAALHRYVKLRRNGAFGPAGDWREANCVRAAAALRSELLSIIPELAATDPTPSTNDNPALCLAMEK